MSLQLYQERVMPTGGLKSEGVQRLLGRPGQNWNTVVLREAVQNSWDARQGDEPVEFDIHWWRPSKEQKSALLGRVFTNEPENSKIRWNISERNFDVMVFSDRGTRGLSGPVAANEAAPSGEKRNFVDFVWEIGRSEGAGSGGGTYGYGKSSFYCLSSVRTICVHTRCKWQGRLEDRFIAAHLGPSAPQLTGRSWWGEVKSESVRPLTGLAAVELAAAIGMPSIGEKTCGTSIMMLCPRTGDLSREDEIETGAPPGHQQVLATLAESPLQWFWPKMVELNGGKPAMRFRIFDQGQEFPVPSPESVPPFNVYSEALRVLEEGPRGNVPSHAKIVAIECARPYKLLGQLAMVKRVKKNRNVNSGEFGEPSARELFAQSHHVALLRKPMLVVKYLKGPRPSSDQADCAGVFVVDHSQVGEDVEKAFALSEPPTHDDWVPETLEDRHHKTYVRGALKRIKEAFAEFVAPVTVDGGAGTQQALGAFSERLGDLLAGSAEATGGRVPPSPPLRPLGGGSVGGKKSTIQLDGATRIVSVDGKRCLAVPFSVALTKGARDVRVRAIPAVLLEQGTEKDPPKDAPLPRVHSFCQILNGKEESVTSAGDELTIPLAKANSRWLVRVSLPGEARVRVDLVVVT